ncbi:MAG: hypothetical protein HY698_13975 [Deltaproteobacteria bacterium]|nr:hypothetical protein [Deltaproteobacteria bacterium]
MTTRMPTDDEFHRNEPSDSAIPAPAEISARVKALVERGLECYAIGDLLGALGEWEHAVALEPGAMLPQDYIRYVRENFQVLNEAFRQAAEMKATALADGVPVPVDPDGDVSDAYAAVEVEIGEKGSGIIHVPPSWASTPTVIDGGWFLEDLVRPDSPSHHPELGDGADHVAEDGASLRPLAGDEVVLEATDEANAPTSPPGDSLDDELAAVSAGLEIIKAGPRVPIVTILPRGEPPVPTALPAPPQAPTPPEVDLELVEIHAADEAEDDDSIAIEEGHVMEVASAGPFQLAAQPSPDDTGESTRPAGHRGAVHALAQDVARLDAVVFAEETPTLERHGLQAIAPAAGELPYLESSSEEDETTGERHVFNVPVPDGVAEPVPSEELPAIIMESPFSEPAQSAGENEIDAEVEFEPISTREGTGRFGVAQILRDAPSEGDGDADRTKDRADRGRAVALDHGGAEVKLDETDEDRIRRRVLDLLQLARHASSQGDHEVAVDAAEMAYREDPEGIVAPVILHRHQGLLCEIFEGLIGPTNQVPIVSVPMHEIASTPLDHRTGFLLSRIDGLLSYEDVIDVAGMPRLDVLRILAHLLRLGYIAPR